MSISFMREWEGRNEDRGNEGIEQEGQLGLPTVWSPSNSVKSGLLKLHAIVLSYLYAWRVAFDGSPRTAAIQTNRWIG